MNDACSFLSADSLNLGYQVSFSGRLSHNVLPAEADETAPFDFALCLYSQLDFGGVTFQKSFQLGEGLHQTVKFCILARGRNVLHLRVQFQGKSAGQLIAHRCGIYFIALGEPQLHNLIPCQNPIDLVCDLFAILRFRQQNINLSPLPEGKAHVSQIFYLFYQLSVNISLYSLHNHRRLQQDCIAALAGQIVKIFAQI